MASRKCKQCESLLDVNDFYPRHAICKKCYSIHIKTKKDTNSKTVKKAKAPITPIMQKRYPLILLNKKLKEMVEISDQCLLTGYDEKLLGLLSDVASILNKVKNDGRFLPFTIDISDVMNEYIKSSIHMGHDIDKITMILADENNVKEFEIIFKINRNELMEHKYELVFLKDMLTADSLNVNNC